MMADKGDCLEVVTAPKPATRIFVDLWEGTVADLVRILQMFPQDQKVRFNAHTGQWSRVQISTDNNGENFVKIDMR